MGGAIGGREKPGHRLHRAISQRACVYELHRAWKLFRQAAESASVQPIHPLAVAPPPLGSLDLRLLGHPSLYTNRQAN